MKTYGNVSENILKHTKNMWKHAKTYEKHIQNMLKHIKTYEKHT
jgi:hypothetical protein